MRRFVGKLALFLAIPLVGNLLLTFAFPIYLFNFRAWEALQPYQDNFYGPFYPDQRIELVEEGDLGHGTPYSIAKQVTFITDSYGYRYSGVAQDDYPVVIVGDSMIVGSSLTQAETPAAVLSTEIGKDVYPLAHVFGTMQTYFYDWRFATYPPEVVVLALTERGIHPGLCWLPVGPNTSEKIELPSPIVRQSHVLVDRFYRTPWYLYQWLTVPFRSRTSVVGSEGMLFYKGSLKMNSLEKVDEIADALATCQTWFTEQGIQVIILPIPDKANIYHDLAGMDSSRSEFLRRVIDESAMRGVTIIDTQTAFEDAREAGIQVYHLDDTHWNAEGVRIAMDLVAEAILEH